MKQCRAGVARPNWVPVRFALPRLAFDKIHRILPLEILLILLILSQLRYG
jgi:hypothetical protein